jgi:ATP-dependent protease Clp ATPase subunit
MTTTAKGGKPYRCSFCSKSQDQVRQLVAGQGVFICDECVAHLYRITQGELPQVTRGDATGPSRSALSAARCSFCGKQREQVQGMVAGKGVHICDECTALCGDIFAEQIASRG